MQGCPFAIAITFFLAESLARHVRFVTCCIPCTSKRQEWIVTNSRVDVNDNSEEAEISSADIKPAKYTVLLHSTFLSLLPLSRSSVFRCNPCHPWIGVLIRKTATTDNSKSAKQESLAVTQVVEQKCLFCFVKQQNATYKMVICKLTNKEFMIATLH